MFGKVMKQELRANSLLYGVASAIALLFAFATVMNRTRGTDVSYLVKAPLLITGCTVAIVVLVMLFLIHTALRYQKSMYGNEGYLTFSLPVSSVELVTGKYAAAALWGIIVCVLCALLCFSILYGACCTLWYRIVLGGSGKSLGNGWYPQFYGPHCRFSDTEYAGNGSHPLSCHYIGASAFYPQRKRYFCHDFLLWH